jgi:aquaporin Z
MMEAEAPCPRQAHRGLHLRIWAAEAAGTALLVLGALSAVALVLGDDSPIADLVPAGSVGLLLTGLLVGATVALIAVSPLGRLSGSHLNPAITLAFGVLGRISVYDVGGYLAAQFIGALLGAFAFHLLWGAVALSVGGGVTHPSVAVPVALGVEAGMTGLLAATILFSLSRERLARWTPLVVWLLLTALIWRFSRYTGTSLNPARSEGPAVAFSDLSDLWIYLVAPIAGAVAVAALWRRARPSMHPKTAKLFHDPRYPSAFSSDLPAMGPGAPVMPKRAPGLKALRAAGALPADLRRTRSQPAPISGSITARPDSGSWRRVRRDGDSVMKTSSVGPTVASIRWPPTGSPS